MDGWQATVVLLAIIGTIIWTIWLVRNRKRWRYSVLPLTYFFNVLFYNLAVVLSLFSPQILDAWTHVVRIHSIFLFTGLGYLFLFDPDTIRVMLNGSYTR
jgi:predicted permease